MEIAAFVISIFALIIGLLALGLAMRALYIIGVDAGLDKQFNPEPAVTPAPVVIKKEFKKPIRTEGNKII